MRAWNKEQECTGSYGQYSIRCSFGSREEKGRGEELCERTGGKQNPHWFLKRPAVPTPAAYPINVSIVKFQYVSPSAGSAVAIIQSICFLTRRTRSRHSNTPCRGPARFSSTFLCQCVAFHCPHSMCGLFRRRRLLDTLAQLPGD